MKAATSASVTCPAHARVGAGRMPGGGGSGCQTTSFLGALAIGSHPSAPVARRQRVVLALPARARAAVVVAAKIWTNRPAVVAHPCGQWATRAAPEAFVSYRLVLGSARYRACATCIGQKPPFAIDFVTHNEAKFCKSL